MPNWVRNKVKFENKEVMEKCYRKENEVEIFDFSKIIEMPKSLNITSGGNENISIMYALNKMESGKRKAIMLKLEQTKVDFYGNYYNKFFKNNNTYTNEEFEKADEELRKYINGEKVDILDNVDYKEMGINNLEDLGNVYINNIIQYGADTWYDWCCDNWGTKWGACHTYYVSEYEVEFDTAWSMPYKIFEEISKKFNTRVEVCFADEDIGSNCGKAIFENGMGTDLLEGDRNFAYKVWDYTDEEIAELEEE